jgi:transcriptional regulator with XRE-family HTH domain
MNAVQCKMARAAVGIGVRELAAAAKVSPDTVARLERGELLRERTVDAIRAALEDAGVEFTNGAQPGVRLTMEKTDDDLITNYLLKGPCLILSRSGGISAESLKDALAKSHELARSGDHVSSIEVLGQVKVRPNQIRRLLEKAPGK